MWAWRDNGKDVGRHKAMRYCRNLRLAKYSDWRLAAIDELEGIYDHKSATSGENPRSPWHDAEYMTFSVKGNLFLTSDREWSSTPEIDENGRASNASFRYFDLQTGSREKGFEDIAEGDFMPALCVRSPRN